MIQSTHIESFWNWFTVRKRRLQKLLDAGDVTSLAREITPSLERLHRGLRWEIGPGKVKGYSLTIWAGGDRSLRRETERIISLARPDPVWEFYPARQPREIPPVIELPGLSIRLKTENWVLRAEKNEDGKRVDLTVVNQQLAALSEAQALHAAFIYLDCALGEDMVEEWIGDIRIAASWAGSTLKMSEIGECLQNYLQTGSLPTTVDP